MPELDRRASGVLAHLTSLPGPHGHGDLGPHAWAFVDALAEAKQRYWQMLPVNPTGAGHSPYSGVSAFAGNPLLISLEQLCEEGLLDIGDLPAPLPAERADYQRSAQLRLPALRKAYARFSAQLAAHEESLMRFVSDAGYWLSDYALFVALRQKAAGQSWTRWSPGLVARDPDALREARTALHEEISYVEFEQFMFARQWQALRQYAQHRGVHLIGDVPIFVDHDSADVWAHKGIFKLRPDGVPRVVSGVPPDYFSETGQRWGTPVYDWWALKADRYRFWVERVRTLLSRFDVVRLDHFIGFARYWEIPFEEATAVNGSWVQGPGASLFETLRQELGSLPFIAEDLGSVSEEVLALRDQFALPGMRVLQFAFGGTPDHLFLPHTYAPNCVAYTGTHDNETAVGWLDDTGQASSTRSPEQATRERKAARAYLLGPGTTHGPDALHWAMIRALFASAAHTVIIPVQDLLGLGNEARMNVPGQREGNWTFRIAPGALDSALVRKLRAYTQTYGRCAAPGFDAGPE